MKGLVSIYAGIRNRNLILLYNIRGFGAAWPKDPVYDLDRPEGTAEVNLATIKDTEGEIGS